MKQPSDVNKNTNTNKTNKSSAGSAVKSAGKTAIKSVSKMPDRWMKAKLFYLVMLLLIAFVCFIASNLYSVAVKKSEYYRMKANGQQLDDLTINANRGTIYDCNGKILAKSSTVWDVIISPYDIELNKNDKAAVCKMLSEVLELDYDNLMKICSNPERRYEVIKRKIEKDMYDELMKRKADEKFAHFAITAIENTKRDYPLDTLASNIIGFTDYDNKGQYGVEAYYDEYLQGINGRCVMLKDGKGRSMTNEYERRYDAVDGGNVHMTVDVVLQHYLEKNLESVVAQHNVANRATGIMMDPNNGAILAMATTMGYDLNNPADLSDADEKHLTNLKDDLIEDARMKSTDGAISEEKMKEIDEAVQKERASMWEIQWRNKAITELYYPGSVFKAITCASALEEKVVTLDSGFSCAGNEVVDGVKINCWNPGGHGSLDLTGAIIKSCNPSLINISNRLGKDKFYDYLEAFGFTKRSGVDLPAEQYPIVVKRDKMSNVDLATSSFGQTNKITPLQMITAFSTCVNGGYLVTPHVVDKITDNEGNVLKSNDAEVRRQILSSETSEQMRQILEDVVEANGGQNAYMAGYRIGGKSGTSQKLDEYPEDERMRYVASFCAFAPADNPKVIILIVVDEPNPGGEPYYGSTVSAPVVSAVFKESFQHLEIYPQFTAEEQIAQDTVVPNLIGLPLLDAKSKLNTVGLKLNEVGEGQRVIKTIPAAGTPIRRDSTVVVYFVDEELRQGEVPNVYDMTVAQANQAITDAGLNIRISGGAAGNENAKAVNMSVEPGTMLNKGSVVEVTFAVDSGHGG